jgi:hypothetical protein
MAFNCDKHNLQHSMQLDDKNLPSIMALSCDKHDLQQRMQLDNIIDHPSWL